MEGGPQDSHDQPSGSAGQPRERYNSYADLEYAAPSCGGRREGLSRWRRLDLPSCDVYKFSNKPGRDYFLWKRTFRNAIRDEGLLPHKEIRYTFMWLGPESVKVVESIYKHQQVWELLDRRYGSYDWMEYSFLDRLDDLHEIDLREPHKLWDFSLILTELRNAQEEPTLPAFTCLEHFMMQEPILHKLPPLLVEKWIELSDAFIHRNPGREPPFALLQEFVARQVRVYNHPQNISLPKKNTARRPKRANREGQRVRRLGLRMKRRAPLSPRGYR